MPGNLPHEATALSHVQAQIDFLEIRAMEEIGDERLFGIQLAALAGDPCPEPKQEE